MPANPITRSRTPAHVVYGAVVLGSTVIAIALTVALPRIGTFWENFVYSQCIGLSICVLTDGPGRLWWRHREPSRWAEALVSLAATIGGLMGGGYVAGRLLGHERFFLERWIARDQLGLIVFVSLLGSLAYHIGFTHRRRLAELRLAAETEKTRAEAAQRQASEAQLGMLRAQIEPHMLFNTLANLRALIGIDPQAAQRMLDRLIGFMRATLTATRQRRVPLAAEFALLDDYLQLIRVRMGDRLRFTLQLPDALRELSVLPLLLQPIVENAVRHGVEPSIDGGWITVDARHADGRLVIDVRNTGVAWRGPPDTGAGAGAGGGTGVAADPRDAANSSASAACGGASTARGGGFGLSQIRERLATAYGPEASLRIGPLDRPIAPDRDAGSEAGAGETVPEGTRVTITLPVDWPDNGENR
ncbi:MAG: histidine kinase [Burkholderiaceae bacterium]